MMNRISPSEQVGGFESVRGSCVERGHTCGNAFCSALPGDLGPCQRRVRTLKRGERLTSDQDGCLKFWIVLSGAAAVCASLTDGRRQIVELEFAGDLICAMASAPGTGGWIEALDDLRVCEVDLSGAAERLKNDVGFVREMFKYVHERLGRAANHQVALGRLDGMERMCQFLAVIARRAGHRNGGGIRVHLPMSRGDIADYLGLNAETVSRLLGRIRKQELVIFLAPTELVLPDIEALEARAPELWRNDPGAEA